MTEALRRIRTAAADGREFTIVEYATYRWEPDVAGELKRVRNDCTYFETECGLSAVARPDRWSYFFPHLELTVYTLLDSDTDENAMHAAMQPSR